MSAEEEWTAHQEERFGSEDELVDEDALRNPIQRERIDVAVKFVGPDAGRVLDVGCSAGGISELIHHLGGNECWGMDLPKVIDRIPPERLKWFHALKGDVSRRPWPWSERFQEIPTGFFDAILAGEIVEHFFDIEPFFTEAHRVLKPGGRLVITTPNATRALNRIAMLFGQVHTFHEWERIPHHCRFWTPSDLNQALKKYHFQPIEWGTGRSQAEGGAEIGFIRSWVDDNLTVDERRVILKLFERLMPSPLDRHSFIVVNARSV